VRPPPGPPPTEVLTCAAEWEKDTAKHHHGSQGVVQLNCGKGKAISKVIFADYGLAAGTCARGFAINASCNSAKSTARAVGEACLGKQWCELRASDSAFKDRCSGVCKKLTVQVACEPSTTQQPQQAGVGGSNSALPLKCYTDTRADDPENARYTSVTGASTAAFAALPGSAAGVLALVPFLKARNGRRGATTHGLEASGWMTGFALEGVYSAASATSEGALPVAAVAAAAAFGFDTLTNVGNNSWLGMIRQNASMTMESWTQPPFGSEGGGTMSHPWTASPAFVIPRYLMGIRPIEDGWRRVAIKPMPSVKLAAASIAVPTLRGDVTLSFESAATQGKFSANVTVPGNTFAEFCLPRYLLDAGGSKTCKMEVGAKPAKLKPFMHLACLAHDLGPGTHMAELSCE